MDKLLTSDKHLLRILRFLKVNGPVQMTLFDGPEPGQIMLSSGGAHASSLPQSQSTSPPPPSPPRLLTSEEALLRLRSDDLIQLQGGQCEITAPGLAWLRRQERMGDQDWEGRFQNQHRALKQEKIPMPDGPQTVSRNLNESPLSRLRSLRNREGKPYLGDAAFAAGERLRADFTHAQLMPSVTSNWTAAVGEGAGGGWGAGGKVDLSDRALDARDRVNRALSHVGPDLAPVLTDVCCYLKGLHTVERERGWPPRSAKLMVRTGLGLLARFYGTEAGAPFRRQPGPRLQSP